MTDQEIAEGLMRGAEDAFHALYEAYGASVLAYLTRVTGRREMAEELTQETFLTAIRKIGFFRAGPDGSLKAWLFRIATHRTIDVLRREKKVQLLNHDVPELDPSEAGPSAHDSLEHHQFAEAFKAALNEIAPAQRMMFLLKEQEEMSILEISRVCGCSANAVKQSLFRARTALRKLLCK